LNFNWKEAKNLIVKQAKRSKALYDSEYKSEPPSDKVGDQVRLRQKSIQQVLKPKLRNDRFGESHQIIEVLSPQYIKLKWNKKTKKVNVNNVKPKKPDRIIYKSDLEQGCCSSRNRTEQQYSRRQSYYTKLGRQIRPCVKI
jgi:hypothetical protein